MVILAEVAGFDLQHSKDPLAGSSTNGNVGGISSEVKLEQVLGLLCEEAVSLYGRAVPGLMNNFVTLLKN